MAHRPALMFSGDLILSAAAVFIPGAGDASEDIQAEGFEGEMEPRGADEDIDTFRQESQENSYDIDQGKKTQSWRGSSLGAGFSLLYGTILQPV